MSGFVCKKEIVSEMKSQKSEPCEKESNLEAESPSFENMFRLNDFVKKDSLHGIFAHIS